MITCRYNAQYTKEVTELLRQLPMKPSINLLDFLNWANIKSLQDYLKLDNDIPILIDNYLQNKGIKYDLINQSSLDTITNCIELILCGNNENLFNKKQEFNVSEFLNYANIHFKEDYDNCPKLTTLIYKYIQRTYLYKYDLIGSHSILRICDAIRKVL